VNKPIRNKQMPDETIVDTAGVTRTAEGQISDGQTTQTDQSPSSTTPETMESGKTLLTEDKSPEKAEVKAAEGAPEKYSDYKLPDGVTLAPEVKTEADNLFKGLGLSQDAAQSLVDFYGKQISELASAPAKAYQEMTDGWRKDSESHPDLRGKLGPGQEINVRISKALDGLGDPKLASDFKAAMDLTGVGNHPAFIRVISRLAEKVTEGTHVAGNGPSKEGQSQSGRTAPPSAAAAMWPTLPSSTRQ
jgi:hypothetical protein